MSKHKIVHREVMRLAGNPELISQYITTPERILDYYPNPIGCGVIDPGHRFYCQGKSGISLIERVEPGASATDGSPTVNGKSSSEGNAANSIEVTVKVSTATPFDGEITVEKIDQNLLFTMYEDWHLQRDGNGTLLTKTWRDIVKNKMKLLPMGLIVRFSAKSESKVLVAAWNQQSAAERPAA